VSDQAVPVAPRLDSLALFSGALSLPEQVRRAAEVVDDSRYPGHDDIANVVVLGSGAAAVAASIIPVVAGPLMSVPVVAHQGFGLPNFVGRDTLVFVVSFSGDTDETLEAAEAAAVAGARLVGVSAGGRLQELCRTWDAPHIGVDPAIGPSRAALGALTVPMLVVLGRLGWFPGADAWIDATVHQLTRRSEQLARADSEAKQLARTIDGTMPIFYGGGGLGAVAAQRAKTQCNLNAKIPAWAGAVPAVTHDEVSGWGFHGDITRQIHTLVCLRHEFEHPTVATRFAQLDEVMGEVVHRVVHVEAHGEGPLAQLLDLVLLTDVASLHLADALGVDPGPVGAFGLLDAAIMA
jgi:glucose/mannose-6-phosphate isomerase